jgi:hypothetical protein
MKWAYVKFRNMELGKRFQFSLVPIPQGLTVVQFRSLWRDDPESAVYVPTRTLPLNDHERIYDYIEEFDTVILASSWVGHHGLEQRTARSASTMP